MASEESPAEADTGSSLLLNQPVVIDNGTATLKAGFAGSTKPKVSSDMTTQKIIEPIEKINPDEPVAVDTNMKTKYLFAASNKLLSIIFAYRWSLALRLEEQNICGSCPEVHSKRNRVFRVRLPFLWGENLTIIEGHLSWNIPWTRGM